MLSSKKKHICSLMDIIYFYSLDKDLHLMLTFSSILFIFLTLLLLLLNESGVNEWRKSVDC